MLGQVIIYHKDILALVHKVLTHGAAGIRCNILKRCQLGRGRCYDNRVIHGARLGQILYQRRYGRVFLTDGDIDANDILAALVDDGIHRQCRLTGLAVTDNQLSLTSANRNHGVNRLDTGLQRHIYRLTLDNARCRRLNWTGFCRFNRALAVYRLTQCVYDAAEKRLANRHRYNLAGALDGISLTNTLVGTQHNDRD